MAAESDRRPAGTPARRSGPWRLFMGVVALAMFAGLLALGTWQVERRTWKLALIERVENQLRAAPVDPPATLEDPRRDEYRRLRLTDGRHVLVNRGFVTPERRDRATRGERGPTAPGAGDGATTTLVGLLRLSEPGGGFMRRNDPAAGRWHSRDVVAMAQAAHLAPASPFFIDAGLPGAAPDTGWPRAGLTVIRFHNSHLVYALTWYGLAAMVLVAAGLLWRQPATVGGGTPQPAP